MTAGDEVFEYIEGLGGEKLLAIWLLTVAALIFLACFALHWRKLQYEARLRSLRRELEARK